jgi:hypothetical protein
MLEIFPSDPGGGVTENQDVLFAAARLLIDHVNADKKLLPITKRYGLDPRQYIAVDSILTLVDQGDLDEKNQKRLRKLLNRNDLTKFLLDYYRAENQDTDDKLYQAVKKSGDFGNNSRIKDYLGSYRCYRKMKIGQGLIEGLISITYNDTFGSYFFDHKTSLNLAYEGTTETRNYSHTGPVFAASKRIYLLGVGHDRDGNYIRPMILRDVDQVEKTPLVGLLLTETNDHEPYACKIVLLHDDLMQSNDARFGRDVDREGEILKLLSYESMATGVLFGWSSNADKLGVTV